MLFVRDCEYSCCYRRSCYRGVVIFLLVYVVEVVVSVPSRAASGECLQWYLLRVLCHLCAPCLTTCLSLSHPLSFSQSSTLIPPNTANTIPPFHHPSTLLPYHVTPPSLSTTPQGHHSLNATLSSPSATSTISITRYTIINTMGGNTSSLSSLTQRCFPHCHYSQLRIFLITIICM